MTDTENSVILCSIIIWRILGCVTDMENSGLLYSMIIRRFLGCVTDTENCNIVFHNNEENSGLCDGRTDERTNGESSDNKVFH